MYMLSIAEHSELGTSSFRSLVMISLPGAVAPPAPTPATFQLLTNIDNDPNAPPPGTDNSTLSWRLNSLTSDWVLTLGHQTYNVHRCIVTGELWSRQLWSR